VRRYKVIFLTMVFCLCACREVVVHDLSETDANKMMTKLLNEELDVSKEKQPDGRWALSLPKEQATQAIRFLSNHRMLKEEPLKISQKAGLMVSKEEQRFRYERGLSSEIETTLSTMSGVLQARVHLNLPIIDPIFGQNIDASKSSASVMLILDNRLIQNSEISALVAGASGIPVSSISVVTYMEGETDPKGDIKPINTTATPRIQVEGAGRSSNLAVKNNFLSQSISLLPYLKSFFATFPWAWIGGVTGLTFMVLGVYRIVYRHEKVAM